MKMGIKWVAGFVVACAAGSASAQSYYTNAIGLWNTSGSWSNGAAATGSNLVFGAIRASIATNDMASGTSFGWVDFINNNTTIRQATAGNYYYFTGFTNEASRTTLWAIDTVFSNTTIAPVIVNLGTALTMSGVITNNSGLELTVTNTGATTISGAIAGTPGLTKTGSGTLILSGSNAFFTGNIYIKAGTLADQLGGNYGDTRNWGSPTNTIYLGDATVGADATLATESNAGYSGLASSTNPIIVVSGGGTRTIRVLSNVTASAWIGGDITLNNNLQFIYDRVGGVNLKISGNITGTGNLTFASTLGSAPISLTGASINPVGIITNSSLSTGGSTISGNIGSNVTAVVQNSASSVLKLSGTNTYSGPTTISLGTLQITGGSASNSAFTVAVTGTNDVQANYAIAGLNDVGGVGGLVLNNKNNSTNTLTLVGSGNYSFAGTLKNGSNGVATTLALTKTGLGTQTLSSANSYSGATTISNGYIAVGGTMALGTNLVTMAGGNLGGATGSGTLSNIINLASSANFDTSAGNLTLVGAITNNGSLTKLNAGTLTLSGANTYSGRTTNSAGWLLVGGTMAVGTNLVTMAGGNLGGATGSGTLSNVINLASSANFDTSAGNLTLVGAITNNGSLTKLSAGTLTLSGANTYSGGTTISGGTLALNNSSALGTSGGINISSLASLDASAVGGGFALAGGRSLTNRGTFTGGLIIQSGANVSGGGSFNGAVTNLSGGTLTPGIGGDTNFFKSLTLAGGSTNLFWIGNTAHDMSVVTNSLDYTGSGMPQLKLDLGSYTWNSGDQTLLYQNLGTSAFDGASRYFQFQDAFGNTTNLLNGVFFSAVTAGSATNLFSVRYDFNSGDGTANDILLTAIPEPATLNLLVMLGAAYWLRRRLHSQRRRWDV